MHLLVPGHRAALRADDSEIEPFDMAQQGDIVFFSLRFSEEMPYEVS